MCLISQLRPKKGSDKRESPPEARNNGEVSVARGRPHAPVKGVLVRLAEKHGDHVNGWLHHLDHPLTHQCRVGVLKVAYVKATRCDGPVYCVQGDKGAPPPKRHISRARKSFLWPPRANVVPLSAFDRPTKNRSGWRRGLPSP